LGKCALWVDLLRAPLNGAAFADRAAAILPDARVSIERIAKRNLRAARRIVELLCDEVRRAKSYEKQEPPDEDETADEFNLRCLEQTDAGTALEAGEVLDELAEIAASEIHSRAESGLDRSALRRLAAVVREAIGDDALLSQYIDPETGERHNETADDPSADDMVDEGDPNTD
jgi:hypothetical protein